MTLRPQWVVEAFYSGNDLYDAFNTVYTRKQFIDLRSRDQSVVSTIEKAETESPLNQTVERLSQAINFDHRPIPAKTPARRFLSEHSRLYGLLRAARRVVTTQTVYTVSPDVLWSEQVSLAPRSGGAWVPFERGRVRTILTPQYRLAALNMEDPRIREGLRVSIEAVRRMSSMTQNTGVRFTTVLIPTKELAFYDTFGDDADGALGAVAEVAHEEQKMWTELKNELRVSGISYIDTLPALCESIREGESPYPMNTDGHPNAQGYTAIAAAVWHGLAAAER
jgi:hypothetical protein